MRARLDAATAILAKARDIYLLGLGGSFPVATHLAYVLRKLGRRVMLLDGIGGSIHEQSHPAGPEDALVAISFRNYYPDTARLFPELVARGVPAISITDSLLSPIVEGAKVVFEIQDMPEPALRTLVAPMCLVQASPSGSISRQTDFFKIKENNMTSSDGARPLQGKIALVTGAGRGLGRAFAERLASLGADIAIHGMRENGPAEYGEGTTLTAVAEAVAADHGVRTVRVLGDLTKGDDIERIVETTSRALGPIDILVHNAGGDIAAAGGKPDPNDAVGIREEDVRAVLDRNLLAPS